ncbi:MAG: Hpt domain-containing protein [Gammaproteobacteria bacterium]|nr:Hpt domain-containing protein [Gammaproteobacteria bacterium]
MDNFDDKLEELFANFRRQLPARLTTCLDAWEIYQKSHDDEALNQLRFQTHKLAGAASIYGFEDIGNTARTIELLVDNYYNGEIKDTEKFSVELMPHIAELKQRILGIELRN